MRGLYKSMRRAGRASRPLAAAVTAGVGSSAFYEHVIIHGQSNAAGLGGKPPLSEDLDAAAAMFALGTNTWSSTNSPTAPASRTGDFSIVALDPAVSGYESTLVQLANLRANVASAAVRKVVATYSGEGAKRLAQLSSIDAGTAPSKGYWPTLLDDMDRVKAAATAAGSLYRLRSFGVVSCEADCDFVINPGEAASAPATARDTVSSRLRMMFREAAAKATALGSSAPKCWAVQPSAVAATAHFTIAQAVLNAVNPDWVDPINAEACYTNSLCIGPSYPYDSAMNSYYGATRDPDDFTGYTGRTTGERIHYTPQAHRLMAAKAHQALAVKEASGENVAMYAYQVTQDADFPGDRTRFIIWLKVYAPPVVLDTSYFPQFFSYGMAAYPDSNTGTIVSGQTVSSISVYDDGQGEAVNGVSGAVAGIARLKVRFTGAALPANSRLAIGRYPQLGSNAAYTFNSQAAGPTRRRRATYDYTFADASGTLAALATTLFKRGTFYSSKAAGTGPSNIYFDELVSTGGGVTVLRGEQALGGSVTAGATYNMLYLTQGTNFRDSDATALGVDYADTFYGDQTLIGTAMPAYNWLCCGELAIP